MFGKLAVRAVRRLAKYFALLGLMFLVLLLVSVVKESAREKLLPDGAFLLGLGGVMFLAALYEQWKWEKSGGPPGRPQ